MNFAVFILSALFSCMAVMAIEYAAPGPTFEASKYTKWDKQTVKGSRKGKIYVPFKADDGSDDFVSVIRLDLVGDSQARGFAHGALLYKGESSRKYFS